MLDSDLFPEVVRVRVPELRVFQIGRLVAEKRPLDLLDAISRLSIEQREGLKVTYVGDGPLGGELRNRIRDQRLGEVVRVMPATKDVMSVYSEADLLVLTSAWEGTPNVLLEGMATGCPVISYDVGDVGRIVRDGVDGYVVSSTPESLAFRLATILDQRNALGELGRSASRRVRNLHSASRLRESMVGLYSGL
jgi:glycosyltransferase involved in cell wall biosynthesis